MNTVKDNGASDTQEPLYKQLRWVLLGTLAILVLPMLGTILSDEMRWGPLDFVLAGALLASTGTAYVLGARLVRQRGARILLGGALAALLFLVWAELAVGVFGTPFAGS